MKTKIWLSSPHMGGQEQKYIQQAFEENWIAPLGPNVNGLEMDIEKFLGSSVHVAAVSSGSAALHLALILLGVKPGDDVICQSLTFSASANSILYVGAHPIFVDSERETWNICPILLEKAIKERIAFGKKPKAIITVCLYGMPYQVDEIRALSIKYQIPIIEDSAEALGSKYKGRNVGTFGDISIFSFNGNKIITTSGGGALVLKDSHYKKKAIYLSTQAKDDAPHYEHTTLGYNYRMSNVSAGIGRGQMEVLPERVKQRRANHLFYKELLKNIPGITMLQEPNENFYSNHWLSAIIIDPEITGFTREDLRIAFERENIESRPIWKPMHLQPVFRNEISFVNGISEDLFKNGLCLPSGSSLTNEDRIRIVNVFEKFIQFQSHQFNLSKFINSIASGFL